MELGIKIIKILELQKLGTQARTNRPYQVVIFEHDKDVFKGMYYLDRDVKLHEGDEVVASIILTGKKETKQTAQGQPFIDYNTFFILNQVVTVGRSAVWTPPKQNQQWIPQQQTINEQAYNTTRQAQLQEQEQDDDDVLPDWMNELEIQKENNNE